MRLLDDATLDRVYADLVRPLLFEDLSASAAPELIMVGGQPGAGRFATGLASPSALPRFTLPSYHIDALAQMPKTLAAVVKLAKVVRFVDRQGRELYSSRASTVSPVKALEDLRRLPLPAGERQRIAQQWAALVQRLDRDDFPEIVRQGVKYEHARFVAMPEKGRAAPSGRPQEGLDR